MDRREAIRIHLGEQTCPVCGISHDHHIERALVATKYYLWLVWDRNLCTKCEEWADSVKTINPEISQHQTAWYSD